MGSERAPFGKRPRFAPALVALLVGSISPAARAQVQASGGIALPSPQTAVFTNPAGLGELGSGGLTFQAGGGEQSYEPLFRAGMLMGNSLFGLAGGVSYQARSGNRPNEISSFFGAGLALGELSLGLAGHSGIKDAADTDFNLGLRYHPEQFALGITAIGVKDGVGEFGLGFAFELMDGVWAVLDAAMDGDFGSPDAKPGLRIGSELISVTASWGSGDCRQFAEGPSLGAQVSVSSLAILEAQYQGGPFPKYYGAFTLGF